MLKRVATNCAQVSGMLIVCICKLLPTISKINTCYLPAYQVRVGNIRAHIGHLHYQYSIWDYETFRYGIIGAICGLVLLVVIIIVGCVIAKRRKNNSEADGTLKKEKSNWRKKSSKRLRSFISAYDSPKGKQRSPLCVFLLGCGMGGSQWLC